MLGWGSRLAGQASRDTGLRRHGGWSRQDRGAVAVEAALVLPLLFLIIFGVIDFGRLLNAQITVTEAAREGARAEALGAEAATRAGVLTDALHGAVSINVEQSCPTPANPAVDATVTVTNQFEFITPVGAIAGMFGGGLAESIQVTGKGVMPCMQ
ncbi:MAG: pilus assembly protein [Micromonosporaceae bacterium]|nr:pilus assembly protein [Micromonosporaceae bacterium]